jgi:uncharacterized protein with HEPN domain
MAKRTIVARLDDILRAISNVEAIVSRLDAEAFESDMIARLAIERCLEIISEASRHIPPERTGMYPEVSWPNIRAIGSRLRHEYDQLDSLIIWNTAALAVPELKPVIQAMIAALEADNQE